MSFSLLKHKECGGNLHPDVTHLFTIRTPSITYSPDGINIGIVELNIDNSVAPKLRLFCEKCKVHFSTEDSEEMSVRCMTCNQLKNVSEISNCVQISAICDDCVEILREGYKGEIPPYLKSVSQYLRITRDLMLVRFLDTFNGRITF